VLTISYYSAALHIAAKKCTIKGLSIDFSREEYHTLLHNTYWLAYHFGELANRAG
jgi:hypothetical protein